MRTWSVIRRRSVRREFGLDPAVDDVDRDGDAMDAEYGETAVEPGTFGESLRKEHFVPLSMRRIGSNPMMIVIPLKTCCLCPVC
jgi:hypothetical protein